MKFAAFISAYMARSPILSFRCPECHLFAASVDIAWQEPGQLFVAACRECRTEFDWRPQIRDHCLYGAALTLKIYCDLSEGAWIYPNRIETLSDSFNHEHCNFCWQRISDTSWPDGIQEAYTDQDQDSWVCPRCYDLLKDIFKWKIAEQS